MYRDDNPAITLYTHYIYNCSNMGSKAPINPRTGKPDWDYTPPSSPAVKRHEEYIQRIEQDEEESRSSFDDEGRSDGLPTGKFGYRDDEGNFIEQYDPDNWGSI